MGCRHPGESAVGRNLDGRLGKVSRCQRSAWAGADSWDAKPTTVRKSRQGQGQTLYSIIAQGGPNDSDETYRTVGSATGAEPGIDARANVAVIDIAEVAPIESGCPGVAI